MINFCHLQMLLVIFKTFVTSVTFLWLWFEIPYRAGFLKQNNYNHETGDFYVCVLFTYINSY